MPEGQPGALFLVGTPIGNLGDITLRAVETLRSADCIAAEDTRRTRELLTHLGIGRKPLVALDAHAGSRKLDALLDRVAQGERVAFVTDAGMPSVSDPGTELVRAAVERGVTVSVIPGPSAVATAVALSGLVESAYRFLGFLPRKGSKRREAIAGIARSPEPVVLFESPRRTGQTLAELAVAMPGRRAVVCRELTKLHEEALRGTLATLTALGGEFRGEVTLVIEAGDQSGVTAADPPRLGMDALEARARQLLAQGLSAKTVVTELLGPSGLPRRELYALVQRAKGGKP